MSKTNKKNTSTQRRGTGHNGNGNPDKIKGQGFHTNPERINRKGRPKLLSDVNAELQAQGYEKATLSQIADNYSYLVNCDETKLQQIAKDPKAPYILRKLATTLSTDKFLEVLEMIMNRSYGRTRQHIEISEADAPEPEVSSQSEAELLEKVKARLEQIDKEEEVDKTE